MRLAPSLILTSYQTKVPKGRILAERRLVRKLDMRFLPMVTLIYLMNHIDVSCSSSHTDSQIYFCSFQRSAITTARLKGLEDDLGLTGTVHLYTFEVFAKTCLQTSSTTSSFLFSTSLTVHPNSIEYGNSFSRSKRRLSNLLCAQDFELRSEVTFLWIRWRTLRSLRFRPSLYIGGCVIAWGVVSALTGVSIVLYNITPAHLIRCHQVTHSFKDILICRLFLGIPEVKGSFLPLVDC